MSASLTPQIMKVFKAGRFFWIYQTHISIHFRGAGPTILIHEAG